MKRFEIKTLALLCSILLLIGLVASFNMKTSAEKTVLFSSDFEEEGAKSIYRSENTNGKSIITDEVPGGREGHCVKGNLVKSFVGLQPKGIGDTLYKYGTFKEGDTFHLRLDLYLDKEGDIGLYPFILLCINGFNPKTKEEKLDNYDEWYPKENLGTLTINEGSSTVHGQEWTTLDYTFTVKDGCSSKDRDISFWTDSGAFYLYFESSMVNLDVYVDNVTIDMETNNEPTKTLPTLSTTSKSTTTTTTMNVTQPTATDYYAIRGDANKDSSVNMKDILLIRKYMAHIDVEIDLNLADYNNDGLVNMKDILGIRKLMAGI